VSKSALLAAVSEKGGAVDETTFKNILTRLRKKLTKNVFAVSGEQLSGLPEDEVRRILIQLVEGQDDAYYQLGFKLL